MCCSLAAVPCGHSEHISALSSLILFSGHFVHLSVVVSLKVPAQQSTAEVSAYCYCLLLLLLDAVVIEYCHVLGVCQHSVKNTVHILYYGGKHTLL